MCEKTLILFQPLREKIVRRTKPHGVRGVTRNLPQLKADQSLI
jgi:hypothetical protein